MPKPFKLTDRLLAAHRSGAQLCLSPTNVGTSFVLRAERPRSFARVPVASLAAGYKVEAGNDAEPISSGVPSAPGAVAGSMVAVIEIRSLLSSEVSGWDCGWSTGYSGEGGIVEQAQDAFTDPMVCAVVFDIMSPGGDSLGLGEAASQIAAMRIQSGKPSMVYARQALSAAYWLAACAAGDGGLFVSESSDVANIGAWTMHEDFSKADEQDGIKVTYVASPAGKVAGNPDEPLAPEAAARLQRNVDEVTARFVAAVAEARPRINTGALLALDGDTRRGAIAVAQGLADGMCSGLEEVVQLAYAVSLAAAPPAPAATYQTPAGIAPASKGTPMPFSAALLAAAGLTAGVSDAAAEAVIVQRLSLSSFVLEKLGEKDPVRARGTVAAKIEEAASAGALREQLAAKSQESDAARRDRAWETAVTSGRLRAGQVFKQVEVDGKRSKALSDFATKISSAHPHTDALEGYLESLPALPVSSEKGPAASTVLAEEVDRQVAARGLAATIQPATAALAKRRGIDPVALAHNTALLFGSGTNEEG